MTGRIVALLAAAALGLAALTGCGAADQGVSGTVVDKQIEHDGAALEYELVVETASGEKHIFAVTDKAEWDRYTKGQAVSSDDFDQAADD